MTNIGLHYKPVWARWLIGSGHLGEHLPERKGIDFVLKRHLLQLSIAISAGSLAH